jgi:hypothetical protein
MCPRKLSLIILQGIETRPAIIFGNGSVGCMMRTEYSELRERLFSLKKKFAADGKRRI